MKGWFAHPDWQIPPGPLPLACLAPPCGIRAHAMRALEDAGIRWREVLTGGGIHAVIAAARAGLALVPLASRIAPETLVDVGPSLNLPTLPPSQIVLYSRITDRLANRLVTHLAQRVRIPR